MGSTLKSLCIVDNLLGHGNAIRLATEYDAKIVILLLMVYFERLNLIVVNALAVVATINVWVRNLKKICLVWGPQLRNLHMH